MIEIARIYSRKKGRSGSKKPPVKMKPKWVKQRKQEIEKLIVKLAKERHSSALIGTILRDKYGIPSVKAIIGKSIVQIMKENDIYPELPEDLLSLLKKAVNLHEHLEKNKADKHSKKGLENLESKIRRLAKYYIRKKVLPADWRYSYEEAKLIVQK